MPGEGAGLGGTQGEGSGHPAGLSCLAAGSVALCFKMMSETLRSFVPLSVCILPPTVEESKRLQGETPGAVFVSRR